MFRRSLSALAAGTLAAAGLDLLFILAIPADRPTPLAFVLVAALSPSSELGWLGRRDCGGGFIGWARRLQCTYELYRICDVQRAWQPAPRN
jgi:hypothetical protein